MPGKKKDKHYFILLKNIKPPARPASQKITVKNLETFNEHIQFIRGDLNLRALNELEIRGTEMITSDDD